MSVLCCIIFTSCSNELENLSVAETETSLLSKNIYFYGSDVEFEKLQTEEMKYVNDEEQLRHINKTESNSYILFVGKDIDIRSGFVNDLRNSGILVTQLVYGSDQVKNEITHHESIMIKAPVSNSKNNSRVKDNLHENLLLFTTYLSVNGTHEILGSATQNIEELISEIIEWEEKKLTESRKISVGKSSSSPTLETAMNFSFNWTDRAMFAIDTEVYHAKTNGYILNNGSQSFEYPDTFIYEHKITATPTNPNGTWTVGNIQVIQYADYQNFPSLPLDTSLRQYSPLNSSNGVLDGSSGSDSFGYGLNFGIDPSGGSLGSAFDWSHSTDWSIPACQVNTFHNPSNEIFHVMYQIDPNGSWNGNSVTAENYTYYSTNFASVGFNPSYHHNPTKYFVNMKSTDNNVADRDFWVKMNSSGQMLVRLYYWGYFDHPDNYLSFNYSW